jgi:hypothetical protein
MGDNKYCTSTSTLRFQSPKLTRISDSRQGLAFVDVTPHPKEPGKYSLTKRMVSTSHLASVLTRYRVRRVVLNACRSAHYQDADDSIALGILKAGVEECVAMTFDVVSRAVEIFMSILYDAILVKGLTLDAAAAWARQALRLKPDRDSRYTTRVPVYDYVIPVCYTHVLLRHLSAWWQETGLATGVYLHDCRAATPQWDVEGFWRGAHDRLLPTAEYHGPDAVVEYLGRTAVF